MSPFKTHVMQPGAAKGVTLTLLGRCPFGCLGYVLLWCGCTWVAAVLVTVTSCPAVLLRYAGVSTAEGRAAAAIIW
jgi:hypothetical protein